jgi:hypothetical protein
LKVFEIGHQSGLQRIAEDVALVFGVIPAQMDINLKLNGRRQDIPVVIVCVLPDQVDPSRGNHFNGSNIRGLGGHQLELFANPRYKRNATR